MLYSVERIRSQNLSILLQTWTLATKGQQYSNKSMQKANSGAKL